MLNIKKLLIYPSVLVFACLASNADSAPVSKILNVASNEDPYITINSVFGATATKDVADSCSHIEAPEKHITSVYDNDLRKQVFEIVSHGDDKDCVTDTAQRARTEIKVDKASPLAVKIAGQETTWSFLLKLDEGFQPTDSFTHLFQAKAENLSGEKEKQPRIRLSLYYRQGVPTVELNSADDEGNFNNVPLVSVKASKLIGRWVQVILKARWSDQGALKFTLKRHADGKRIKYYANPNIDLWHSEWEYMRFKAGIYREYDSISMQDVSVRFANIKLGPVR
ncbi:MAG: heparin lyase I family protein [Methylococcaceae bacterium]